MAYNAAELSILIVDDPTIRELNATYRKLDRATDVLSFSLLEGQGIQTEAMGDVVISLETAKRQAERRHHSLDDELRFLIIHGILHLVGYDHKKIKERRIMRAKEQEILKLFGK